MYHPSRTDPFTDIFLEYRPTLRRIACRILGRHRTATDDIMQDVWIRASAAAKRCEVRSYKAWLCRITFTLALNYLRKAARDPSISWHVHNEGGEFTMEPFDPSVPADRRSDHLRMFRTINRLERRIPCQIDTLRLVHLAEMTHSEAARVLGRKEGTAKSNAFKAVNHLREAMLDANLAA